MSPSSADKDAKLVELRDRQNVEDAAERLVEYIEEVRKHSRARRACAGRLKARPVGRSVACPGVMADERVVEHLVAAAEKVLEYVTSADVSVHRLGCPPWSAGTGTCTCGMSDLAQAVKRVQSRQ